MCTQFCIELPEKTPLQIILNFFLHIFLSFFLNFFSNFFNHILFISHSQVTIHPITNRGGCGHVNCIALRLPPFKSSFYYIKKKKTLSLCSQIHNPTTVILQISRASDHICLCAQYILRVHCCCKNGSVVVLFVNFNMNL